MTSHANPQAGTDQTRLNNQDPSDIPYFRHLGPLAAAKYAFTMSAALFEAERKGLTQGKFAAPCTFQMFTRSLPYTGIGDERSSFMISAGLLPIAEWLQGWRFTKKDLEVLAEERTPGGEPLYSREFLHFLSRDRLQVSIDAMPDGELAFPREPMLRVSGPFYQCVMLEDMILNIKNSCTDFATLAAQAVIAADGRPVYEFGTRRAQDIGGLAPAYAAYIAGFSGTSNYLARKHMGIPAFGTMAHALVMLAEDEMDAFASWAQGMPGLGIFLVDTYDTLDGVRNAIETCRTHGVALNGIRLDSGDLAYLSKEARKLMDEAGFPGAKIFAGNDLNPSKIDNLLRVQQAPIDVPVIGTWLASASANPALGGVYKLACMLDELGIPYNKMKFSQDTGKSTLPGALDVVRTIGPDGLFSGDIITRLDDGLGADRLTSDVTSINPDDPLRDKAFPAGTQIHRPLQPFWRPEIGVVSDYTNLEVARKRAADNLARLDPTHRRLMNQHRYVAGVEQHLYGEFTGTIRANSLRHTRPQQRPQQQLAL